ncbi:MAG TPA: hypothetical protein VNW90_16895 [Acetobacteraceae bacterium]|jgi:hypothetical protein|nr:hypothetical protein [Acetobacteraceae bacterium]
MSARLGNAYAGLGRCIYCGTIPKLPERLTKEHIIPFGLSGPYYINAASCASCARRTQKIEEICLQDMLLPMRVYAKTRSRHKTVRKPVKIRIGTAEGERFVDATFDQIPIAGIMPRLLPPRILLGLPPALDSFIAQAGIFTKPEVSPLRLELGATCIDTVHHFDVADFSAMLAKIGWCYAVAEHRRDRIAPWVVSSILGRFFDPNYFVGGTLEPEEPPEPDILHRISTKYTTISDRLMLIVKIRLFANLGSPSYYVVAGPIER